MYCTAKHAKHAQQRKCCIDRVLWAFGCNLIVSVANSKAQLKDKTVCSTVVTVQVPAVSS